MSSSEQKNPAGIFAWLVAVSFFVATVLTFLLQFNVTASPPREVPPNDIFEGTLAFFESETNRWPQEMARLLLFTIGFLSLVALAVLLRNKLGRDDQTGSLGALALAVGGVIGAVGQMLFLGAKEMAIHPNYCDCARAVEQIISRGEILGVLDNAQRWLVATFLLLAGVGLFMVWRSIRERQLFTAGLRNLTVVLAAVLTLAVIALVAQIGPLFDVFTALGAGILTPVWALTLARNLQGSGKHAL